MNANEQFRFKLILQLNIEFIDYTIIQWRLIVVALIILTVAIKFIFYKRIRKNKSRNEFQRSFIKWYDYPEIYNVGSDKNRKQFMRVSNYCMTIFWISLLAEILLLLY